MSACIACLQAAIIEAGALPALAALLQRAQPDGQYAAAAALYNLTGQEPEVRQALVTLGALPHLVQMLHAESWYAFPVALQSSRVMCWVWVCVRMCMRASSSSITSCQNCCCTTPVGCCWCV